MINESITSLIIKSLIYNEDYARKCLPYINERYFKNPSEKWLVKEIKAFIIDYGNAPTKEALSIKLNKDTSLNETIHNSVSEYIGKLVKPETVKLDFLIKETEEFCKEQALQNAILDSVGILNNDDKSKPKTAIPDIIKEALSVTFDPNIGHDYFEDANARFDHYHAVLEKVPFDLEYFNKITGGGTPKKTLNILLAGTNVGKSLSMCHMATANIRDGKNVLYITLEMAEEEIAKRIDCNLLNVPITQLLDIPEADYKRKLSHLKQKLIGKLVVKEYPTSSAGVSNFRALLTELFLKKNFVPDIIYVDYLNLCQSDRFKAMSDSFSYFKAVAEELRGLAVEADVPIWTATQTNRTGFGSSDFGLTETAESFGLPMTADFMVALITNEDLEQMNKIMVKQLKSRYGDVSKNRRFHIGIDKLKMRLYNLDDNDSKVNTQNNSNTSDSDDKPVFDKSAFGEGMKAERKEKFDDWKF
jgi:archaellum biogenesis ATPase FlaH